MKSKNDNAKYTDRLNIIKEYKQYLLMLEKVLENVPKKDYICRSNFYNDSIDVLRLIYYANNLEGDERLKIQKDIIARISVLDFYIERLIVLKHITSGSATKISNQLIKIRKMIYGWL